mmetsp:Transcript_35772/g.77685  ORF Transcript_35772/g.77685 Transcript_35772/m.77685 type:complete len:319 (-) Transcript_35772:93-1049(-)
MTRIQDLDILVVLLDQHSTMLLSSVISKLPDVMPSTPVLFQLLLLTSFLVSSIGFIKLVWFISIGYGYAVAATAIVMGYVLCFSDAPVLGSPLRTLPLSMQLVLLFAYGVRLGTYVLQRERNKHYQTAAKENYGDKSRASLVAKAAVWVSVAPLYVAMVSPAAFNLMYVCGNEERKDVIFATWSEPVGLAIMTFGLVLEGLADRQKAAAKKINPKRFCDKQLFSWVRCPNYFGEILFWVGNWITPVACCYVVWWHWALSLSGLACIISIMLGSTKRLEANQQKRYGTDPEFVDYAGRVPVLFPFVPIYSLQGVKYTLG